MPCARAAIAVCWLRHFRFTLKRRSSTDALIAYLSEITERVIREEVHNETGEAEEMDEPSRIGR